MGEHERSEGPLTTSQHLAASDPGEPPSSTRDGCLEALSALYDGQADAHEQELALQGCRSDPLVMRAWQDWHLAGDVMRSEDLAPSRGRDEAFLERFRAELAREPVILAPSSSAVAPASRPSPARARPWRAVRLRSAMAVAAGFMTVAVAVWLVQGEARGTRDGWQAGLAAFGRAVGVLPAEEPSWQAVDGRLIRDAQLDSYLRAHRAGAPALPGGVTGRFETVVLEP